METLHRGLHVSASGLALQGTKLLSAHHQAQVYATSLV
jgi:hypothetical protein